jgi:uncharacterized protein
MSSAEPFAQKLRYAVLEESFAICRMGARTALPEWAMRGAVFSVTRTRDELSIVCAASAVPRDVTHTAGFACLKLCGPFALEESGVLASFLAPLAQARVPAFALSTYDTDYVLVPGSRVEAALRALEAAGHLRENGNR